MDDSGCFESVMATAILCAVVGWGSRLRVVDNSRLNKPIHKASITGVELNSDSRCQMIADNPSH